MQTMGTNGEDSFLRSVRAELVDAVSSVVVTAEEFRERVQNEASQLSNCGVRAGSIALLEARSDVRFLSRLMALFELKAVAVPFDSKITETERQRLLSVVRPSHCYLSEADAPDAVLSISKEVPALPKAACLLLLTSGTTGLPKAVIHGFSNLQARIANGRQAISLEQRRSCLSVLPLHFGHGLIGVVLQALLDSERLVLVPPELGDPSLASQIGKWIDAYDVTFVSGTPGTWSYITRMSPPPGKRSLRRVQMASAHATPELQEKVRTWSQAPFYNCYGTTETASWISDRLHEEGVESNNVGSGKNWNSTFEILMPDENGVGEIAVTTSSRAFGYLGEWRDGVKSPARYATGDFGKFNESGDLLILGRKSRIINRGGLKVSPEEIEREVMSLGVVQDVVVLAASEIRSVATNVDSIVGIVVLKEGLDQAETEKALSQGLLKTLSPHKVPGKWLSWNSIPRRANGKPDMPAIKQKFGSCKNSV